MCYNIAVPARIYYRRAFTPFAFRFGWVRGRRRFEVGTCRRRPRLFFGASKNEKTSSLPCGVWSRSLGSASRASSMLRRSLRSRRRSRGRVRCASNRRHAWAVRRSFVFVARLLQRADFRRLWLRRGRRLRRRARARVCA